MSPPLPSPFFPLLSLEEIILGCQQINLALTEQDLRQPTTLLAEKVWEQWSSTFLGTNIEDSNRATLDRLDKMDYPEIYENAMKSRLFYRTVHQLASAAQIPIFSNSDLTNPQSHRLVYALSGLINFQLFESEQTEETLQPLMDEKRVMAEQQQELERSSQELRERIAAEKAKRLENEPKVAKARLEEVRRKADLNEMMAGGTKIKERVEAYKSDVIRLAERRAELTKEQFRLQGDVNRLKTQIVRSPERLRKDIIGLKDDLTRTTEELKATELKAHQLSSKIASLQKYEVDLQSCNNIARDLATDVRKLTDGEQRLRKLEDELSRLESEREELEEKSRILTRRVDNLRREISRFDEKNQYKRETGKARKKTLEDQLAQLTDTQREIDISAADVNRKASEIEALIRAIHNETHAVLDKSEALYKEMVDSVGLYNLQVNKAIDAMHTTCATRLVL